MMPVIQRQEFAQSDLPGYLKKEIKELIEAAVMVGWTLHVDRSGISCSIRSYNERKIIHFGTKRSTRVNQVRRDIIRFADPKLLARADEGARKDDPLAYLTMPKLRDGVSVHEEPQPDEPVDSPCDRAETHLDHGPHTWYDRDDKDHLYPFTCEGYATPASPVTGPHVVSQRPMLAKGRNDKGYLSRTTFEQTMSDGTTRYACQFEGCDYTSFERQAVPSHWAATKSHPDVSESEQFKADVPNKSHYRPRQNRIAALAEVLMAVDQREPDEAVDPDYEEMALAALTWVHEQSNQGTDLSAEREEMSSDEIVARIRAMLDTGQMGAVVTENERLAARVSELEERTASAEARAERAHQQWVALAEIIRQEAEVAQPDTGVPQRTGTDS